MDDVIRQNIEKLGRWAGLDGLDRALEDIRPNRPLLDSIERKVAGVDFFRKKRLASMDELGLFRITLGVLCLAVKPALFIETGVLHGLTSSVILSALRANEKGRLISIDLPSHFGQPPANQDGFTDTLPPDLGPGWVVEDAYRERWELILGSVRDRLPDVCRNSGGIDIFLHDSEHTYSTMTFEYETAWPNLCGGGYLVSDNIDVNTAFFDFCVQVGRAPLVFPNGPGNDGLEHSIRFGMIRK